VAPWIAASGHCIGALGCSGEEWALRGVVPAASVEAEAEATEAEATEALARVAVEGGCPAVVAPA
jgi:hypothetical protein